ncbi:MAG TPA: response regulator [Myxococcaceae bacterium]|nr:response regulator [Myxococcaceae bacterium]
MTTSPSDGPSHRSAIIVDDDRDTREMLAMALELEGYEVTQAANGVKLISSLHVHRPDILLLDVNMSWIDGFELCRAVRRNEQLRTLPVLFISARNARADVEAGLASGADGYFTKPIDFDALLGRMRELVEQRSGGVQR